MMLKLSDLRAALLPLFPAVPTILRRLVERGVLPSGGPGFGGAHSAALSPSEAALVLLACGCGAAPKAAAALAGDLAAYRLTACFEPRIGPSWRVVISSPTRLGDWLGREIEAATDPAWFGIGLLIEPGARVSTIDAAELAAVERTPDDRPVLRDVSRTREKLEFQPAQRRPSSRMTILRPEAVRAAASAFRPTAVAEPVAMRRRA